LAAQLVLGMETLLSKFTLIWPTGERIEPAVYLSALIPSLHFLVGALTFSSAVVIALLAHRHVAWAAEPAAEARRQLEGAL
jgi:membrane protein implicated in regulation of membrane protease activity